MTYDHTIAYCIIKFTSLHSHKNLGSHSKVVLIIQKWTVLLPVFMFSNSFFYVQLFSLYTLPILQESVQAPHPSGKAVSEKGF